MPSKGVDAVEGAPQGALVKMGEEWKSEPDTRAVGMSQFSGGKLKNPENDLKHVALHGEDLETPLMMTEPEKLVKKGGRVTTLIAEDADSWINGTGTSSKSYDRDSGAASPSGARLCGLQGARHLKTGNVAQGTSSV